MDKYLVIGFILFFSIGVFYFEKRKRKQQPVMRREDLSDEVIYDKYYASLGLEKKKIAELWHGVAEALDIPAGKLRPSDVFGKDIGVVVMGMSDQLDTLEALIYEKLADCGLEGEKVTFSTLDEYMKFFAVQDGKCRDKV